MSRAVGPIAVLPADGQGPLLPGVSETSEQTQQLVDEEVRRIVEAAHDEATVTLSSHRANLDALVAALLERETLDQDEAYDAAGLPQNLQAQPEEAPPVGPAALRRLATAGGGRRSRPRARARSRSTPRRRPASTDTPRRRRAWPGSR